MNGFLLKAMLSHYAANPPNAAEVDRIFDNYKDKLSQVHPDQLESLKPQYPMLVPAIDQIKQRLAQTMVVPK